MHKSFMSLLSVQPRPTEDAVDKSYAKVQNRIDKLFKSLDDIISLLGSGEVTGEESSSTFDLDTENSEYMTYDEKLLSEQTEIESRYVSFKQASAPTLPVSTPQRTNSVQVPAPVRLTALSPTSILESFEGRVLHLEEEIYSHNGGSETIR